MTPCGSARSTKVAVLLLVAAMPVVPSALLPVVVKWLPPPVATIPLALRLVVAWLPRLVATTPLALLLVAAWLPRLLATIPLVLLPPLRLQAPIRSALLLLRQPPNQPFRVPSMRQSDGP